MKKLPSTGPHPDRRREGNSLEAQTTSDLTALIDAIRAFVFVVRSSSGTYLGPRDGYATQAEAEAAIKKAVGR